MGIKRHGERKAWEGPRRERAGLRVPEVWGAAGPRGWRLWKHLLSFLCAPLLGLQANLGHRGRASGASVRRCAFRGAGLAGLHLHPAGPSQRPPSRGEAQVPQHRACCAGWDLRGTVRLSHARPPSASSPNPSSLAALVFQAPPVARAPHVHLVRSSSADLPTWASFYYFPLGCSGERTPLWVPPIPLRSSTASR